LSRCWWGGKEGNDEGEGEEKEGEEEEEFNEVQRHGGMWVFFLVGGWGVLLLLLLFNLAMFPFV